MTTTTIGTERVKVASTGTVYVASKSVKGLWHTVRQGRCDCPGYGHRGTCRHVELAIGILGEQAQAQQPPKAEPQAVAEPFVSTMTAIPLPEDVQRLIDEIWGPQR